jgi:putative chitinase
METLKEGDSGKKVIKLQKRQEALGFSPGNIDGEFGPANRAALIAYQKSESLLADGIAGPRTQTALGMTDDDMLPSAIPAVTVSVVSRMFPVTPVGNIKQYLPQVLNALVEAALAEKPMVLMALATIRAETEGFEPISEGRSKYNTSPNGHPFDLCDNRRDLGNQGGGDGEKFRGRGFIQLTGRANYQTHGAAIGLGKQLVNKPELANDPVIASRLLASFLKAKERTIKEALQENDLR